jgi:VanZ family protein
MGGPRYPPARIGGVRLVTRLAPPLALMGLIFFLSAQSDLSSGLGVWDTIGRKLVHMAAFGALWFLWWRASGYGHPGPAIAITLLYAVSDEYHQTFTEGRHGSPWDVAIDAAGVGLAGLLVAVRKRRAYSQPRSVA